MKIYAITVKGKRHEWVFLFRDTGIGLDDWRKDGLVVDEVCNIIPLWVPGRLTRLWVWLQDHFIGFGV